MKLVKPKKFLGQHFLKDLKVAQDIADTVDTFPELPILEVGPGMGVLTQFLVKKDRLVKSLKWTTNRLPISAKPIRHWKITLSKTIF